MKEQENLNRIITIPNLLSAFRLVLAFAFLAAYVNTESKEDYYLALGMLVLSAFTDVIDGKIARHFHMISNLGKILDPIADKVTQGFVMLALLNRYPLMLAEIMIFLVKEAYMGIVGLKVIRTAGENKGALWYGKLNTVILYGTSLILILFFEIPAAAANIMILCCCISILFCWYKYHREYMHILKECKKGHTEK